MPSRRHLLALLVAVGAASAGLGAGLASAGPSAEQPPRGLWTAFPLGTTTAEAKGDVAGVRTERVRAATATNAESTGSRSSRTLGLVVLVTILLELACIPVVAAIRRARRTS